MMESGNQHKVPLSRVKNRAEPAHSVITLLGGCRPLAALLLQADPDNAPHFSSIAHWQRSKAEDGTGGTIPTKYWPGLLKVAEQQKKKGVVEKLLAAHGKAKSATPRE